jgi:hypothetical protein
MAKNVKKFPFPDHLLVTPCVITLDKKSVNEDGEVETLAPISTRCMWSEHTKRVYDADGKKVTLGGQVIVKGDIAPKQPEISSGTVQIGKRVLNIYEAVRARNPDGSVHHTCLKLI